MSFRRSVAVVCVVTIAFALGWHPGAQDASRRTWMDYGGGPDNARYLTLDAITRDNVGQLRVAWFYATGDDRAYSFNPVIAHGLMYVLAHGALVALNAATGEQVWVHDDVQGISIRGINYWESADGADRRLIFQKGNALHEVDARTGVPLAAFGTNGRVDLKAGFDGHDPARIGNVQSDTPGKVFGNLLLLGSGTGEDYLSTPGDLRAYDIVTGREVWRFHTIPHPGEFGYETWPKDAWKYVGGVNTWGEITVDRERGIAYFPLGSPSYDYYGADRHGANLFGTSILALDARTGRRLWHFQLVHHDLWDYDPAAAPQLTTIRRDGRTIEVVAVAGKTGFLYVFDRVTGQPIWPIEERPVPQSDVPGEASWPTQPFPTSPPPFVRQSLSVADLNPYVLTAAERAGWATRLRTARNRGLFTPPAVGVDTVAVPGAQGGANWGTTAANPTDGTVYVLGINVPSIYNLSLTRRGSNPATPYPVGVDAPPVRYYTAYGMQNTLLRPPYTTLTAYDLNTGTIRWQVPAGGDYAPAAKDGAIDAGYPVARTGIITTVTGLLFHAGVDRKLRVYDAASGRPIWAGDLPAGARGVPAMYEVGGRQFIVVTATQRGVEADGAAMGAARRGYVAFALPER